MPETTKNDIKIRMAAIEEAAWPPPAQQKKLPPNLLKSHPPSDFLKSGMERFPEIVSRIYNDMIKRYGTNHKPAY